MLIDSMTLLEVTPADFRAVARLVDVGPGLRAADAVHLAIAIRHDCSLVTRDRDLAAAATATGVEAQLLRAIDTQPTSPY